MPLAYTLCRLQIKSLLRNGAGTGGTQHIRIEMTRQNAEEDLKQTRQDVSVTL